MLFSRLTLARRFTLLLGLILGGFVLYGAVSYRALDHLKVNGPLYQAIVLHKDLVADVLPPPEYIIESYLVTLQMTRAAPAELPPLGERLKKLKAEYDARHAFWLTAPLDPAMARLMLKDAHDPANRFFNTSFSRFIPALQQGDRAAAEQAMQAMAADYEIHRKAIDQVVERALKRTSDEEQGAAASIVSTHWLLLAVFGLSLAAALGVALAILRGVQKRLGGEPDYAADICGRIAAGRLDLDIDLKPGDQDSLLYAMHLMQQRLSAAVAGIQRAAENVSSGAQQIAAGNGDLSSRTEHQAASLEEATRAMARLTTNVRDSADDARQADELARTAASVAENGGTVVANVVATMEAIHASSARIKDITGVIDGIAFQTNILALNAAVEAARAGEQGRGFAVVASEVRSLAQRSATAAKEIKALIDASAAQLDQGSVQVREAGTSIVDVVGSVRRVNEIIGRLTGASVSQSGGIEQLNHTVAEMENVAVQNAALVEQAAAAAVSLQEQAAELARAVSAFQLHQPAAPQPARPAAPRPAPRALLSA